jgi:hypothetical protein
MRAKMMLHALNCKQFAIWIRFWSIHGKIYNGKNYLQLEAGSSFVNKVVSDPRLPLAELK